MSLDAPPAIFGIGQIIPENHAILGFDSILFASHNILYKSL